MRFMHRNRRFLSIVTLLAILLGGSVTPASAVFDPETGRFLQRDPNGVGIVLQQALSYQARNPVVTVSAAYELQFADGMNFYEYLQSNPGNGTDPSGLWSKGEILATVSIGAYVSGSMIGATRTAIDLIGSRDKHDLTATEIAILISRNAGLTGLTGLAAVLIGAPIVASGPAGAALFAALGLGTSAVGFAYGQAEIQDAQDYHELSLGVFDTFTAGIGVIGSGLGLRAAALWARRGLYGHLTDPPGVAAGKDFTRAQRAEIIASNRSRNRGVVRSDKSGAELTQPTPCRPGSTHEPNEWAVDHVVPKSKGGTNSYTNAQVLSRAENTVKSDH